MAHRRPAGVWLNLVVLFAVACGSTGPSKADAAWIPPPPSGSQIAPGRSVAAPSDTPSPAGVGSIPFVEYAALYCDAFESMDRAVGNPDTASGSERSRALDAAVLARDAAASGPLAASIIADLEVARRQAALAGAGWPSARPFMAHFDRLILAFQAQVAAKLAIAEGRSEAGEPQAAFEAAGGLDAWFGFQRTSGQVDRPPGGTEPCLSVPYVTP